MLLQQTERATQQMSEENNPLIVVVFNMFGWATDTDLLQTIGIFCAANLRYIIFRRVAAVPLRGKR